MSDLLSTIARYPIGNHEVSDFSSQSHNISRFDGMIYNLNKTDQSIQIDGRQLVGQGMLK